MSACNEYYVSLTQYLMIIGLALLVLAGPMTVAMMIYRRFPDGAIVNGPLNGFDVKLTGAFAAFFILFVAFSAQFNSALSFVYQLHDQIKSSCVEGWNISINGLELRDARGNPTSEASSQLVKLLVKRPDGFTHDYLPVRIKLAQNRLEDFPDITLQAPLTINSELLGATITKEQIMSMPSCPPKKKDDCIDLASKEVYLSKYQMFQTPVSTSGIVQSPATYQNAEDTFLPVKR